MANKKVLLIVEDDPGIQKQLKWSFEHYKVVIAGDKVAAIDALRRYSPMVVTLDLGLPPDPTNASEGLATLKEILKLAPATKVIVVTGNDDRENAIQAVALGAYDFYQKPIDLDVLNLIIDRAFQLGVLEHENKLMRLNANEPLKGFISSSECMQKLTQIVKKVAPSQASILLLGESGTGKEVLAKAIHGLSDRASERMVSVNCAAIPDNLLESELFGYERGAFSGAVKKTIGKIEYADGGTFFLDEIGDLPFSLQAKLLRVLQERVVERLGGRQEIPVDVRIICATHQNIEQSIVDGTFREDLYYRINEITVNIPPLREREGDAIVIATSFLRRFSQENKKKIMGFTEEAARLIENFNWPGNVRQLENTIKRAVIMADNSYLTPHDLDLEPSSKEMIPLNLKKVTELAETQAIKRALAYTDNNVSNAAKLLGVSRPTLYALSKKYGIKIKENS